MTQLSILDAARAAARAANTPQTPPQPDFAEQVEEILSRTDCPDRRRIIQFLAWVVSARRYDDYTGKWTAYMQFPLYMTPIALGLQALAQDYVIAKVTHDLHSIEITDLAKLVEIFS